MNPKISQLILVICATALVLAAPFLNPLVTGVFGILFAAAMYFIANIRYFAIGAAVLALLYAIGFIHLSAFAGPLLMILWGEGLRMLLRRFGHEMVVFAAGSIAALAAVMLYTGEADPLVGCIAVLVLLMLRSILTDREDGSMLSLIGVSMTIVLFEDLEFLVDMKMLALAVILCAAFGYFAYRAKTIDMSGVFSAVLFGVILITFTKGIAWFIVVMAFFILGSVFTKFKYSEKEFLGVAQGKSGRRGYKNAFANAGVGIVACILFGLTGDMVYAALFLGSIATATADTLASEVGVTGGTPYMITTMKPCPPGTNGGVTVLGEAACLFGSLVIALLGFFLGVAPWYVCVIAAAAGFIGTNLDSLYGALMENKGLFGNAGTNLLATLSGGLAAVGIYLLAGIFI
ncbi:MAG: TIGR00297 family protein [Methanocorpusculum sp.]|nr:TIGR00297 family protein [Methanocorpusculum sp.]